MSAYTEFIKGMMDNCIVSKTYWCNEKDQYDAEVHGIGRLSMIMDKLIALDRDIRLFTEIIRKFEEYDTI